MLCYRNQAERFKCFFTWLISLTVLAIALMTWQLKKNVNGIPGVGCSVDGDHWLFADCGARFCLMFLHVFTTMQCAAMARVVFVKTVKKVRNEVNFSSIKTMNEAGLNRALRGDDQEDGYKPPDANGNV